MFLQRLLPVVKMASSQGGRIASEEKLLKQAAQQIQRAKVPVNYKKKNVFVFAGLLTSVMGIYAYSIFSIQQEKLDFDK